MKINTKYSTTVVSRWTRLLGAMLTLAIMVPAVAFSQIAPTLVSPADGVSEVSTSPMFSWSSQAGDSVYHLQITTDPGFAFWIYNDSTLTGVSNIVTGLVNSTTYYWRVSMKRTFVTGGGTSPYSTPRSFTTWLTTPPPTPPPLPVALGSTARFAILSAAGVTNIGTSSITGDVGTSPIDGSAITGWNTVTVVGTTFVVGPAGPVPSGAFTTNAALLTQAMGDLTTAYNDAAGRSLNAIAVSGNLGGRTLYPGLYKSTGTLEITAGDLYLDAQNDTNAVWIFQIATSFNMTSGRQVFLTGGALASNVFWQVGSLASFGTTAVMKGTILAGTACTFATGATLEGRALAKTENVTLQGNTIVRPLIPIVYNNPSTVVLGTAANFRILAGSAVTIAAATTVFENVGCPTVTNNGIVNGDIWVTTLTGGGTQSNTHPVGTTVSDALTDLAGAISTASGLTANATLGPQLAGTTLGRGVYNSTSGTFDITGTLILNGTAVDTFIFQMTTTLNSAANSHVMLVGGALASNVFWQVGSAATIGTNSDFKGIIMAGTSYITQGAGASIEGRALAHDSYVTVNGTSVLPVELAAFTATANRMNADLHWSTATEVNNYGFEIERRQTATWAKVGFVSGAGTSNSPRDYSYTDNNLSPGRYTYRLKQVDNNGAFSYHGSVEVVIGLAPQEFALFQNYPNPFNPSTMISYQLPVNSQVTLKVYDVLGKEVATLVNGEMKAGSYTVPFSAISGNTPTLASGVYIYRLNAGSFVSTKKLVLMK